MTKWHINNKGIPAICKATKGNCPFGSQDSHYESKEIAQKAADNIGESKHGLLGVEKNKKEKIIKTNASTDTNVPLSLDNFINHGKGIDNFNISFVLY